DVVQGCFIGTDPSGTIALGNQEYGISMTGAGSRLGTNGDGIDDYAERNLISGNQNTGANVSGTSILVAGNYFGTEANGTQALGNRVGVQIFGPSPAPGDRRTLLGVDGQCLNPTAMRNVISGNSNAGVEADGYLVISGNLIGTDASGTQPLG